MSTAINDAETLPIELTPQSPTVSIVDDDPGLCDSLRYLIESVGLRVRTYLKHTDFFADYDPDRPGCIVLDLRMPGKSGLEVQEMLKQRASPHPIIIITGHGDVSMAIRAMKAGAFDFIEKPFSEQILLGRIQGAVEMDARQRREKTRLEEIRSRFSNITDRERHVMVRMVAGQSNKRIADALGVSPKTVENHRTRIRAKTGCKSVAQLVHFCIAAGIVEDIDQLQKEGNFVAAPAESASATFDAQTGSAGSDDSLPPFQFPPAPSWIEKTPP